MSEFGIQCSTSTASSETMTYVSNKTKETQYNILHCLGGKYLKHERNLQNLLTELNKNNSLAKLSTLLIEHEQTDKFVKLIHALASKKLKMSNMSWKAALDMGNLSMCTSTTTMIYDKEWLEFCQVLYHMFGGGIMNTL